MDNAVVTLHHSAIDQTHSATGRERGPRGHSTPSLPHRMKEDTYTKEINFPPCKRVTRAAPTHMRSVGTPCRPNRECVVQGGRENCVCYEETEYKQLQVV